MVGEQLYSFDRGVLRWRCGRVVTWPATEQRGGSSGGLLDLYKQRNSEGADVTRRGFSARRLVGRGAAGGALHRPVNDAVDVPNCAAAVGRAPLRPLGSVA